MKDYIVRASAANAQIRAFAAVTTELTEEARKRHETSPVATAALGRLLTGGAMMGSMMKNDTDMLTIQIKCSGPIGGLTVTADSKGNVKGYVHEPNVILPPKNGKLDVGGALGQGVMTVIKDMGENIGYAEDNMKKEKIVEAAKSACAHSFIKTLPGGYDMTLSKGAENISQGERQLLTIARAIASDPEIMILDEATSNVDTHTEVLIQKAMAELMKGRTSFVIAHRLSTIRDADRILYMEDGDIKEVGNHEELMKKNGKYAALYMSQFA